MFGIDFSSTGSAFLVALPQELKQSTPAKTPNFLRFPGNKFIVIQYIQV